MFLWNLEMIKASVGSGRTFILSVDVSDDGSDPTRPVSKGFPLNKGISL